MTTKGNGINNEGLELNEEGNSSAKNGSEDIVRPLPTRKYPPKRKPLRQMTRDVLPRMDHYRNIHSIIRRGPSGPQAQRPTLDDLQKPREEKNEENEKKNLEEIEEDEDNDNDEIADPNENKFGWIKGVLVRCLLNIWGVMLFLRLSWVTGQAGILQGIGIVLCGNIVTTITTLSMSAISTNGRIKAGGTYYMISRSLGPEFGGAIGILFAFANAVAAAMYVVGFCESLHDLLHSNGLSIFNDVTQETRLVGSVVLILLFGICLVGMEWEARAQVILLGVLIIAMLSFVIGVCVGPLSDSEIAQGFVGFNNELITKNLWSDYRLEEKGVPFFTVFAVFFPACTGILAGANISGDLKDPSSAIPKGTLVAIVITTISYILFIVLCGAGVLRDASGFTEELFNMTYTNCTSRDCQYGLLNSFQVMELVSIFGPIIYAGCFAATLSSALASIVSAPKVFQALCQDKLYPFIEFFAKGYGQSNEPYRGYVLTFIIALSFILIGQLNAIAPIISNFFLAAYAMINFSTFHASLLNTPSWRPTFKYYNMWLSLIGFIMCTAVMFLIEWWTALLTAAIMLILYLIVAYRKPDANWGSSTQAQIYTSALTSMYSLGNIEEHIKTYRPQILVLSGPPSHRPPLVHFANCVTKNMSLLVVGHMEKNTVAHKTRKHLNQEAIKWFKDHKIRGFFAIADGPDENLAARSLMSSVGLGKLRPNTVFLGFKRDWQTCPEEHLINYFNTIHSAFSLHHAVGILRLSEGLDYSHLKLQEDPENKEESKEENEQKEDEGEEGEDNRRGSSMNNDYSVIQQRLKKAIESTVSDSEFREFKKFGKKKKERKYIGDDNSPASPEIVDNMMRYTSKQPKGTIDVWWLFDDGGMTLLVPYILTTRSIWGNCKLRVFCLANKKADIEAEQQSMAELLEKFRIEFTDIVMIADIQKMPSKESMTQFECLIQKFKETNNDDILEEKDEDEEEEENNDQKTDTSSPKCKITESELLTLKDKTQRHIRLRELLLEYSTNATLIVMTLPVPARQSVSAPLYMAWLETLSKDMPPFLLLRGNQTSVLTFYS